MKPVYTISGLGVDERIFQNLVLNSKLVFIRWIKPETNETITNYARRLSDQIKTPDPILMGLSFGGMLAVEIANQIPASKVILISSAKSKSEIPFYFRLAGLLGIDKAYPVKFLRRPSSLKNWFFGIRNNREEQFLTSIMKDADPLFSCWAVNAIVTWKNETLPENVTHIHGTADRILPLRYINADIIVNGGGHFMIVNRAKEISEIINHLLESSQ